MQTAEPEKTRQQIEREAYLWYKKEFEPSTFKKWCELFRQKVSEVGVPCPREDDRGTPEWQRMGQLDNYKNTQKTLFDFLEDALCIAPLERTNAEWKNLEYLILRDCYDAAHYGEREDRRLDQKSHAQDRADEISKEAAVLDNYLEFIRKYPKIVHPVYYKGDPEKLIADIEIMEHDLKKREDDIERMKAALTKEVKRQKSLATNSLKPPNIRNGPLLFPTMHRIRPKRKDTAMDGLIFSLAVRFRCFMKEAHTPGKTIITGEPIGLPEACGNRYEKEIIARFVQAVGLMENKNDWASYTKEDVRNRLNYLISKKVLWIDWDHPAPPPKKPQAPGYEESPYIPPSLFENK